MSQEQSIAKEVEFKPGDTVRCGQFVGMLSWVDPSFTTDKDGKPTGKKTGDCNFVYMTQVPKGVGTGLFGFDGLYFTMKGMRTNVSQIRPL
jgi:hypothetical protein